MTAPAAQLLQLICEHARVKFYECRQEHEHAAGLLRLVQEKPAVPVTRVVPPRPRALAQLLERPASQLLEHQYPEVGLRLKDRAVRQYGDRNYSIKRLGA